MGTQTGQFQPTTQAAMVFTGRKIGQGSRIQKHGRFRMNFHGIFRRPIGPNGCWSQKKGFKGKGNS